MKRDHRSAKDIGMTQSEVQCGRCAHFRFTRQGNAQKVGECRRNAPNARTDGGPQLEAAWPMVLERDGCGEFKPAPDLRPRLKLDSAPGRSEDEVGSTQATRTPRRTRKPSGKRKTR